MPQRVRDNKIYSLVQRQPSSSAEVIRFSNCPDSGQDSLKLIFGFSRSRSKLTKDVAFKVIKLCAAS